MISGLAAAVLILAVGVFIYAVTHRVRGAYFDSNGVRIHFTDQGRGEPVVLVHGYTANADVNWRLPRVIALLQRRFRAIAMDMRGHGLSGKPHDPRQYGIDMVNDVRRLMDHLSIRKAHLVGYSMGGFITLKFISLYPERLISAMPCGAAWMTPSDPLCELANELHAGMIAKNAPASGLRAIPARLQRGFLGAIMDLEALGAVAEGFRELAVTEAELRAVKIPVMAIRGGHDTVVHGGGDLKATLPGYQELVIPGGRHNTAIFYRAFRETIFRFLSEHAIDAH